MKALTQAAAAVTVVVVMVEVVLLLRLLRVLQRDLIGLWSGSGWRILKEQMDLFLGIPVIIAIIYIFIFRYVVVIDFYNAFVHIATFSLILPFFYIF